jgi:hypothetical protein
MSGCRRSWDWWLGFPEIPSRARGSLSTRWFEACFCIAINGEIANIAENLLFQTARNTEFQFGSFGNFGDSGNPVWLILRSY